MAEYYRGPVAYGFEPADAFWTDSKVFEKFAIDCFKGADALGGIETPDEDWGVYDGLGFKLADHRDTGDAYERSDSVSDFVEEGLDLSTCPNTTIVDAYVIEDEERLVVKVISDENDIAEIKQWESSPYETMDLERIDTINDDEYELIYHIRGLNQTYKGLYGEGKKVTKNQLFESILNEDYEELRKAWKDAERYESDITQKNDPIIKQKLRDIQPTTDTAETLAALARKLKGWGPSVRDYVGPRESGLFRKLAGLLLSAAPEVVGDVLSGTVTLSSLPYVVKDAKVRDEINDLKADIIAAQYDKDRKRKAAVDAYNDEFKDLTPGAKVRVVHGQSTRVATIVKQNKSGTYQVQGTKGDKYSVDAKDILPYVSHGDYSKSLGD